MFSLKTTCFHWRRHVFIKDDMFSLKTTFFHVRTTLFLLMTTLFPLITTFFHLKTTFKDDFYHWKTTLCILGWHYWHFVYICLMTFLFLGNIVYTITTYHYHSKTFFTQKIKFLTKSQQLSDDVNICHRKTR